MKPFENHPPVRIDMHLQNGEEVKVTLEMTDVWAAFARGEESVPITFHGPATPEMFFVSTDPSDD